MTEPPVLMSITKAMMLADRIRRDPKKRKNGMSRTSYKDLTGMNESAQVRWEEDDPKKRKQAEFELLEPFIFDAELGAPEVAATWDADETPAADTKTPSGEVPQATDSTVDWGSLSSVVPPAVSYPPVEEPSITEQPPESEAGLPVELVSGEDLDDPELLGDDVIVPGSGLPAKIEYSLEGYHITNSELQTFKRCKRKWYLSYYRELKLIRSDLTGARAIGTRLHLALAAYYSSRGEDPKAVLEHTILEDRVVLNERGDAQGLQDLEKDADLSRIMLEGYLEWIQEEGKDQDLEVIGDEVTVEVPFMTQEQSGWDKPVILMGKMDLRLRRSTDGARFFLDHKSVGSLKEPLKTLHMNEQMLHYHLLEFLELQRATAEGAPVEYARGGMYNMLRKVKRTARSNPPFFDRVEVPHNDYEIRSYYVRVWGEVLDIIELHKKLEAGMDHRMVAYPTPTSNCAWDCDFISVCPLFDDGSAAEDMLGALYEAGNPHAYYAPYGDKAIGDQEGSN